MFMKGIKRQALANLPKRAKPMSLAVLFRLNAFLYTEDRTLRIWRTIWRINLMYRALLRWDGVVRLQV